MPTSYNGWPASPSLRTRPLVVAGESFVPGILDDDDVHTVFQYVAEQLHARVEPIVRPDWHQMDDWGFSYRASTGNANALSCHASGTAIDYNATRHPYGVRGTFTAAQITEVHKILAEVQVVEWGNDWNRPDGMHFEISGTRAEVAAAARRLSTQQEGPDMADIEQVLKRLEDKADRALGQNSRIINKLNQSRDRQQDLLKALDEVAGEVEQGSVIRKKLNKIIADIKAHDDREDEEA